MERGAAYLLRATIEASSSILDAIGNPSLVRLRTCAPENGAEPWLKLEYCGFKYMSLPPYADL
jgi:hypothetical protein